MVKRIQSEKKQTKLYLILLNQASTEHIIVLRYHENSYTRPTKINHKAQF